MSTVQTVTDYANVKIQGNGNISSDQGVLFASEAKLDYRAELIKRGVEAAQIQEAYRDAVVPTEGQGSTFLYPDDMFFLKQISVNYSDTTIQNYIIPRVVDIGNTQQNLSFEFLRQNQPIEDPLLDGRGDWFELFPTFTSQMNLTKAIWIFYYLQPTVYSASTDALEYPETVDPYVLSEKMISLYYERQEKFDKAAYYQKRYLDRVARVVNTLVRDVDRPVTTEGLGLTGYEF